MLPGVGGLRNVSKTPFVDLAKAGDEIAVGVGVVRGHGGDAGAGFLHVTVEADSPCLAGQRIKCPGVHFDILQAVGGEVEFLHDGRAAEHDVRAAADIEAVARDDLLRANRAAHHRATFQHQDATACLGQIAGANEAVVASTDDDAVVRRGHEMKKFEDGGGSWEIR